MAASASLGCAQLIGVDTDHDPYLVRDAGSDSPSPGQDSSEESALPRDAASEAHDDAGIFGDGSMLTDAPDGAVTDAPTESGPDDLPVCGDMSGLQTDAPWPMEGYCPTRPSRGPHRLAQGRRLRWVATFEERIASSPIIAAQGVVYVGTVDDNREVDAKLRAVSPTGSIMWSVSVSPPGFPVTGIVGADGTVYASGGFGVHALNPTSTIRWTRDVGRPTTFPTIGGAGRMYLGTPERILALDTSDGSVTWSIVPPGGYPTSGAIGLDGNLYVATMSGLSEFGGYLFSVDPAGTVRWHANLPNPPSAPPTIGPDGLVYVSTVGGTPQTAQLGAYRSDGTRAFELSFGDYVAPLGRPIIGGNGTIYSLTGSSGQNATALDGSGATLWTRAIGYTFMAGGAGGLNSEVCAASLAGKPFSIQLVCFDASGAPTPWFDSLTTDTGANTPTAPAIGADGTIYFGIGKQLFAVGD